MSLRIVTWNVNGIRNPFGYMPWKDTRSFSAMFDILEADIVCFQELKIQKQDLTDDMVLIPGWDSYFTFPKHKKGYSGVAIYTRQDKVAPIRAEEGITGRLQPPGSTRKGETYLDLPEDVQIGGYPNIDIDDALLLDSEGRAILLDFQAFVLIGTYCPASREEAHRVDFREAFLKAADARIRNLTAMGRRVIWVGDLNIAPEPIDEATAWETFKKHGGDCDEIREWRDRPAKILLRELCEPSENAPLIDVVRTFFPTRTAMYTHWETKINARPGNYGSRIDYILASSDMKSWFESANILEGLLGSDHCPVYAVLRANIDLHGTSGFLADKINLEGTFTNGVRNRPNPAPPKMSARLIPQFSGRRSIKDMFKRSTSALANIDNISSSQTSNNVTQQSSNAVFEESFSKNVTAFSETGREANSTVPARKVIKKDDDVRSPKRLKTTGTKDSPGRMKPASSTNTIGGSAQQRNLMSFFGPKINKEPKTEVHREQGPVSENSFLQISDDDATSTNDAEIRAENNHEAEDEVFIDPFASRDSWSKLFAKPAPPLCEGHQEPCKLMLTKKPGFNRGRSFWMCSRPVGPRGPKERSDQNGDDQWRCKTFIWRTDHRNYATLNNED